ncbi:MAG: hypothetical protein V4857_18890 [Pseudomonadota bacterium]
MDSKQKIHEVHYVLSFFGHLLNETEKIAVGAVAMSVVDKNGLKFQSISLRGGTEPSPEVRALLADGMQPLRFRLAERLLAQHRDLIFENACKNCGQLPATPKAKQCLNCGHSWRDL